MSAAVDLQRVLAVAMGTLGAEHRLSPREGQVCAHIRDCRTPALGGRRERCGGCDYERVHYHSCRDRHCPKCQGRASAKWAERQHRQVLPVTYHHLVFTVPSALNAWVARHPRSVYDQLFASAWATLAAFCSEHQRLGGQGAMSAVLHTWGQRLTRHVHLHCLVPAGALTDDGRWREVSGGYLFPVRALSRRFRGHFVAGLRRRTRAGEFERLAPGEVDATLDALMAVDWVVYSKACLGHTGRVVDYLARYTHRIALTDTRLFAIRGERVALRYLHDREARTHKLLWLDAAELVRRFLLHVLPRGFMRIRHFGFLANRCRAERLAQIRTAIAVPTIESDEPDAGGNGESPGSAYEPCPRCRTGVMHLIAELAPARREGG